MQTYSIIDLDRAKKGQPAYWSPFGRGYSAKKIESSTYELEFALLELRDSKKNLAIFPWPKDETPNAKNPAWFIKARRYVSVYKIYDKARRKAGKPEYFSAYGRGYTAKLGDASGFDGGETKRILAEDKGLGAVYIGRA